MVVDKVSRSVLLVSCSSLGDEIDWHRFWLPSWRRETGARRISKHPGAIFKHRHNPSTGAFNAMD